MHARLPLARGLRRVGKRLTPGRLVLAVLVTRLGPVKPIVGSDCHNDDSLADGHGDSSGGGRAGVDTAAHGQHVCLLAIDDGVRVEFAVGAAAK